MLFPLAEDHPYPHSMSVPKDNGLSLPRLRNYHNDHADGKTGFCRRLFGQSVLVCYGAASFGGADLLYSPSGKRKKPAPLESLFCGSLRGGAVRVWRCEKCRGDTWDFVTVETEEKRVP